MVGASNSSNITGLGQTHCEMSTCMLASVACVGNNIYEMKSENK